VRSVELCGRLVSLHYRWFAHEHEIIEAEGHSKEPGIGTWNDV
jgi:hypothetical protein